MGFLGISQLSTAAYSPALWLSDGADSAAAGVDTDPTSFAQVCTRAADSLATSGLGPQSMNGAGASGPGTTSGEPGWLTGALDGSGPLAGLLGSATSGSHQAGSSPLGSLLGLLSSLFGAQAWGGAAAAGAGGLAAALPGVAKTIAGLLA